MQGRAFKAGALLVAATAMLAGVQARAQHVVTEEEAGKLTLEALTAAPRPVYHSYRSLTRPAMAMRYAYGHRAGSRHVVAAAYHHVAHGHATTSRRHHR